MPKSNRSYFGPALYTVILLRIIVPFLIFKYPLLAFILSFLLDSIDGQLFFSSGFRWELYNFTDKLLDLWWYLFILIYLQTANVFLLSAILLIYRMTGIIYILISKKERLYIFFPNVLEWFFLIYLIFPQTEIVLALIISFFWAIFVEWLVHISKFHLLSKYIFRDEIKWKYK
ncbi:hypothetical protein HY612_02725 [Candidatus Roizmanbacteria bacterium]|nr:hypothetical protein [Candidatus Roizmanbacteria bacterium]